MTEYRELLYRAALDDFNAPLLVEGGVSLELRPAGTHSLADDVRVTELGSLSVDLDSVTFTGSRHIHSTAGGHVTTVEEDIGLGLVSLNPSGAQPWHLLGVSPVGVFAAASACRMTSEQSLRYRSNPTMVAAGLLSPNDPALPVPGDDLVLELEALARDLAAIDPR